MSEHSPKPWLSIGELARRAGVSPDLLRAWERRYRLLSPRRTKTNRRLYSPADVVRIDLMRRNLAAGMPAATAAEQACAARLTAGVGGAATIAAHEVAAAHRELRAALDGFEETAAQRVLERLLAEHSRLAVIRDVVLPYLRETGVRWARDEVTVAQEHFASTFVEARLMAMARGWDRGAGPRALLACPAGERHTLGLIAFGIALHEHGWRIVYLGGDTPAAMIGSAAAAVEPELIVLAAVTRERFEREADQLAALSGRWRCALAGAGAAADASARIGADQLADDPVSAADRVAG